MAFSFGATSQPSFGGFGTTPATSAPATGFGGFGAATSAPAAPPASAGGFGGFGSQPAASTAAPSAFGGFGTAAAAQPAATGFGGFGAAATGQPQPTGFGAFGATTQTQPAFGGFGAAATTSSTGFGGFGAPAATSATGFGGFGASTSKPAGFGTGFGAGTGFGTGATNTGFGAPAAPGLMGQGQAQAVAPGSPVDSLLTAVLHCNLFNDERDGIIARWNMLQASWGKGTAFYSNQAQPVNITPENPLCRFKAIGYSAIPKHDNKDGLVSIMFKKKLGELEAGKTQIVTSLSQLLGNKPGVTVNWETCKAVGSEHAEVVVTVSEAGQVGTSKKVAAQDLSNFLNTQAANLKTMGVEAVIPKLSFSKADINQYLAEPPSGVDPRLWKQAQADNPNPSKLIPVPMIGFKALQTRTNAQELQAKAQASRLDSIASNIGELQKKSTDTQAALSECKRRQVELSHRVLKVLVRQETTRKVGFTLTQQEELLRGQLEALQAELATPTQFKGRLNELLSQVRLQSQAAVLSGGEKYSLDQYAVDDIKCVLKGQQEGIQALVKLLKEDLNDLNVMTSGLEACK